MDVHSTVDKHGANALETSDAQGQQWELQVPALGRDLYLCFPHRDINVLVCLWRVVK